MTDNGLIKEDHNGPLLPNLHANGKVDLRDVCPSQPYDKNEDIATEDKEEADTEKRTCFWATQDDPAVNTLQTLPVVNRDLNLAISNDRGTGNTSLTLVEDRRDQKLGLDTKGPFPKGGAAENVKVYARRKEGVKGKYKAQTNLEPTLGAIREEGEISISDPGDISAAHCEVGAQPEPAIATLDTILFQPQFSPTLPCKSNKKNKEAQEGRDLHISDSEGLTPEQQYPSHSPAPNSGFSKVFSENEEALHMAIARDLGVSYAKTNNRLGSGIKRSAIRKLTLANNVDILCIQEAKKEPIDKTFCQYLWGDDNVSWEFVPSISAAGGLLCLWNNDSFVVDRRVVGRGYILLEGTWTKENKKVCITNVYAPCDLQGKREQWDELKLLKSSLNDGPWCIVGDFNSIRHQHERINSSQSVGNLTSISEFNSWISDMALEEVRSVGRNFTWYRPNGTVMSRLDRFLLSDEWLSQWPDSTQFVLDRDFSDHCPILLRSRTIDWGPKPFKIMDWWLKDKDFQKMVSHRWGNYHPSGWGGYALKMKLKFIKGCLGQWSSQNGVINASKIQNLKKELNALEAGSNASILSQAEVELKKSLQEQLWNAALAYESMLRQKSRVKWLREGDRNSAYFHRLINHRRRVNAIQGLLIADDTLFFGSATTDNIRVLKSILRIFEMVSGLKINYAKSQFGCMGKSEAWCREAALFLNCGQLDIPFSYLGIPVGTTSKSWNTICLPKNKWELGIKDLSKFNEALLGKWGWDLANNQDQLWARILMSKYGGWNALCYGRNRADFSPWWKDLRYVFQQHHRNCIFNNLKWKVGDGTRIKFWKDKWREDDLSLQDKYPTLYQVSTQQNHTINSMGLLIGSRWEWQVQWRRHFFDHEIDMVAAFMADIEAVQIQSSSRDLLI
ncbi:putative ribonuclease H protein [Glycine soja]